MTVDDTRPATPPHTRLTVTWCGALSAYAMGHQELRNQADYPFFVKIKSDQLVAPP